MSKKSISKGKGGEREVAEILTKHLGWEFRRTPHSGSLRNHLKESSTVNRKTFSSDIFVQPDVTLESFPFAIEVKRVADFSYTSMILGTSRQLISYWDQTCDECFNDEYPMLCLRTDRQPWLVFTTFPPMNWSSGVIKIHHRSELLQIGFPLTDMSAPVDDVSVGSLEAFAIWLSQHKEELPDLYTAQQLAKQNINV